MEVPIEKQMNSVSETSGWPLALSLIVFPIVGVILLWVNKGYQKWLPLLLWAYGGLLLFLASVFLLLVLPKLESVYKDLAIEVPAFTVPFTIVTAFLGIIMIIFGFYLKGRVKNNNTTDGVRYSALVLLTTAMFFQGLLPGFLMLSAILPIYQAVSAL